MTTEEIRTVRQEKLDRRIARLRARADRLEKVSDSKCASFRQFREDIALLTQPASIGSSFGKFRQKIMNRYDAGIKLSVEADELRDRANWLEKRGAAVKGDAEARRQAEREENDKVIKIGTTVHDFCFGYGEVTRVNKKTFTIKFTSGGEYARDKSYVQIVDTQS